MANRKELRKLDHSQDKIIFWGEASFLGLVNDDLLKLLVSLSRWVSGGKQITQQATEDDQVLHSPEGLSSGHMVYTCRVFTSNCSQYEIRTDS